MPMLVLGLLTVALLTWLVGEPFFVEWRRERLRRKPFPAEWRGILRRRVPYFQRLPPDLQLQLKRHMQAFLAEKSFVGCADLVVTLEMRVTIAAQACLLLLNRRRTDYFPKLSQILVYPGAFVVQRTRTASAGVLQEQRQILSGESWTMGQVVLSWQDTLEGAAASDDGRNVVIHEFAHQLDQDKGHANGAPHLPNRWLRKSWSRVMNAEFRQLQAMAERGEETLLSHYGATDPAEFFAVSSEVFFEQPLRLASEHPALYELLARYYRVNPLTW